MAERGRFELPIPLRVCRISSAVQSTTLPPLRGGAVSAIGLIHGSAGDDKAPVQIPTTLSSMRRIRRPAPRRAPLQRPSPAPSRALHPGPPARRGRQPSPRLLRGARLRHRRMDRSRQARTPPDQASRASRLGRMGTCLPGNDSQASLLSSRGMGKDRLRREPRPGASIPGPGTAHPFPRSRGASGVGGPAAPFGAAVALLPPDFRTPQRQRSARFSRPRAPGFA